MIIRPGFHLFGQFDLNPAGIPFIRLFLSKFGQGIVYSTILGNNSTKIKTIQPFLPIIQPFPLFFRTAQDISVEIIRLSVTFSTISVSFTNLSVIRPYLSVTPPYLSVKLHIRIQVLHLNTKKPSYNFSRIALFHFIQFIKNNLSIGYAQ